MPLALGFGIVAVIGAAVGLAVYFTTSSSSSSSSSSNTKHNCPTTKSILPVFFSGCDFTLPCDGSFDALKNQTISCTSPYLSSGSSSYKMPLVPWDNFTKTLQVFAKISGELFCKSGTASNGASGLDCLAYNNGNQLCMSNSMSVVCSSSSYIEKTYNVTKFKLPPDSKFCVTSSASDVSQTNECTFVIPVNSLASNPCVDQWCSSICPGSLYLPMFQNFSFCE